MRIAVVILCDGTELAQCDVRAEAVVHVDPYPGGHPRMERVDLPAGWTYRHYNGFLSIDGALCPGCSPAKV